jgi:hypothetical protein
MTQHPPAAALADLDTIIRKSLTQLVVDVSSGWSGQREREIVSLFCFGYLAKAWPGTFLSSPTQVAIECAVPQTASQRHLGKRQVCKDIVIWPNPRMTCWDPSRQPTARPTCIIEWKHNVSGGRDLDWLAEFSEEAEKEGIPFVGYAVLSVIKAASPLDLRCNRVHAGKSSSFIPA